MEKMSAKQHLDFLYVYIYTLGLSVESSLLQLQPLAYSNRAVQTWVGLSSLPDSLVNLYVEKPKHHSCEEGAVLGEGDSEASNPDR